MIRLIRFFSSEIFFFLFLSLISLCLGLFPTLYRYQATPKDRVFVGTDFYSDDYSIYVSNIFQGINGRWTLMDKHTSEPHSGTIIHDEYLLWGKLMGIFRVNQIISFHLARFFLGAIFLALTYYLLIQMFPKNKNLRKLSFFLIILSGGFPIFTSNPDPFSHWHLSWLSEIDIVARTTVLPHYLLGYIFFLISVIFLIKALEKKTKYKKYLFVSVISGNLLALVHPVNLVTLNVSLGIFLLLYLIFIIFQKKTLNPYHLFLYILKPALTVGLFILLSSPVLLYYKSQFNVIPWNHMAIWENLTSFYPGIANLKKYALAIGPTFYLGVLGMLFFVLNPYKILMLIPVFKKGAGYKIFVENSEPADKTIEKRFSFLAGEYFQENFRTQTFYQSFKYFLFLISWIISFFSLIYFSYPILKISQVRFMQNPIFIPFSIFSAIAILIIVDLFSKTIVFLRLSKKYLTIKLFTLSFTLCAIFIISLPTIIFSLTTKLNYYSDLSTLIYPGKKQVEAIDQLKNFTKKEDVIIAAYEASSLIPFLSGNTIYTGHLWATLNYQEKSNKTGEFFSGLYSEKDAKKFLKDGRINFVYYGYQEKSYGGNIQKYPFLKPVFESPDATIFKINM